MARLRGRTTVPSARDPRGAIRQIASALARAEQNAASGADIDVAKVSVPNNGAAATIKVKANHDLGVVPDEFLLSPISATDAASVWATEADRALWSETQITLSTTLSSVKIHVILIKKKETA